MAKADRVLTKEEVERVCVLAKAISDPTRVAVLLCLASEGRVCVLDLCEAVGMKQPAVSHHLALLKSSSVVRTERAGANVFYSLTGDGERVVNAANSFVHSVRP